jgi:arginyl-tRNA synthetase
MTIIEEIKQAFFSHLITNYGFDHATADRGSFSLNTDENKQQFGDLSSNAALALSKQLGKNPRELAQEIATAFKHPHVGKIEIAGPGFLNFFLTPKTWHILAFQLGTDKQDFFKLPVQEPKKTYSVEFVSANPTGPLHLGTGRGGIIGDVLGNILRFVGHTVIKEYYINDAGTQIEKLGRSLKIRCQQVAGQDMPLPEDAYQGEYLLELAKKLMHEQGTEVLEKPLSFFEQYGKEQMLVTIKDTAARFGITFDVWFSEKSLHESGAIEKALEELQKNGYLYEKEGATWFRSTHFGDDKDRVVRKASGELTYVAADIAYLKNKVDRGTQHLIMVLGHDHHSYAIRLEGIRQALGIAAPLDVILYQLVKMKASGQLVRMSKRTGNIVTLLDVIETVGTDVARFFYLNRKADAQLEFDLDLALKKTEENPVYYAQYAYVRTGSILEKAAQEPDLAHITIADCAHMGSTEALLIKKMVDLKNLLETITHNHQTHLLTYYVLELAQTFHGYYSKNRVIDMAHVPQSRARLLLIQLVRETLGTTLELLGIFRPEKM